MQQNTLRGLEAQRDVAWFVSSADAQCAAMGFRP
jgi:hypothetical protein